LGDRLGGSTWGIDLGDRLGGSTWGIDLVGPITRDPSWQAKLPNGFAMGLFVIDWERCVATCPRGKTSLRWYPTTRRGSLIHIEFNPADCLPCPDRARCTRITTGQGARVLRVLRVHPREEYEAIQAARRRQRTQEFAVRYAHRAGLEGTLSQGVRTLGLRRARSRGLARTHVQHVATALNIGRLCSWLNGARPTRSRPSRFARLAAA
jgi:transposase